MLQPLVRRIPPTSAGRPTTPASDSISIDIAFLNSVTCLSLHDIISDLSSLNTSSSNSHTPNHFMGCIFRLPDPSWSSLGRS